MITIRNIKISDLKHLRKLIKDCHPLGFHTLYTYWVLAYHFKELTFVAEENGNLVGYISGLESKRFKNTWFIWQIGVIPSFRGSGLSQKLLKHFFEKAKENYIRYIQVTIDPNNLASLKCFKRFVRKSNFQMNKIDELHLIDEFEKHETYEDIYVIEI